MASFNTLLPSYAVDYVAVFDDDFNQLFTEAKALKAVVKEQAKVMEHPVESGAIITDHRIIMPIEIDLSLILNSDEYPDVYQTIRQYYLNATLLTIQTKTGIYENQLISSMPHEEDPAQFDAVSLALSFKQVQFVTAEFGIVPAQPSNSTTVDRGTQQGTTATGNRGTVLLNWLGGFFS